VTKAAEHAFHIACHEAHIDSRDVGFVVGTGYGRYKITFGNAQMTEISCHARGASYISPATRTVIDMGGQTSVLPAQVVSFNGPRSTWRLALMKSARWH